MSAARPQWSCRPCAEMTHPRATQPALCRRVGVYAQWVLRSRRGARLTDEESAVIDRSIAEVRLYDARQTVIREGVPLQVSTLLLEGLMSRQVDGRDGVRQLVAIQVPGDFVDLHAYPLKTLDHDVGTLTAVRVAIVPHAALNDIQHAYPELARKLWFLTLIDAAMHRQWVFRLGRLRAIQRVAHFLCETDLRLMAIGQSDGLQFRLPLTQFDVAEICGLTSIHVNRVMRELRDQGLCTFRNSLVDIHNLPALVALGEFEPNYLYFDDALSRRFAHAARSQGGQP